MKSHESVWTQHVTGSAVQDVSSLMVLTFLVICDINHLKDVMRWEASPHLSSEEHCSSSLVCVCVLTVHTLTQLYHSQVKSLSTFVGESLPITPCPPFLCQLPCPSFTLHLLSRTQTLHLIRLLFSSPYPSIFISSSVSVSVSSLPLRTKFL